MSQNKVPVAVSLLVGFPMTSLSWIAPDCRRPISTPLSNRPRKLLATNDKSTPSIFFGPEEDFECPDEEECEIDWDRMPGFDEGNEVESPSNEELLPEASFDDNEVPLDDIQPQTYEHQVHNSLEKSRVILEMNWQVDECNVNHDSCSNFCPECAGRYVVQNFKPCYT
jgi:hypothetical protein